MNDAELAAELRELGRSLDVAAPEPGVTATAVLDRIAELDDVPATSRLAGVLAAARRYRVRIVAAAVAVMMALALTPSVRAVVAEWFGFGGVVVRPGPAEPSAPPPPSAGAHLSLDAALGLIAFDAVVPEHLGGPDGVEVSDDRRVLTLSWNSDGAVIRLDQFDGGLGAQFMKTALMGDTAEPVDIGGAEAFWFSEPHDLVVLGDERTTTGPSRVAGRTLVWTVGDVTLRLEGTGREHAITIAASVLGTE